MNPDNFVKTIDFFEKLVYNEKRMREILYTPYLRGLLLADLT